MYSNFAVPAGLTRDVLFTAELECHINQVHVVQTGLAAVNGSSAHWCPVLPSPARSALSDVSYTYFDVQKDDSYRHRAELATTGAVPAMKPEATAIRDPQDGHWKTTLTFIYSLPITVRNQWTKASHTAI